ncbi:MULTISPECIES: hypothetical protein [Bacillus]|uniref:hypothetical protein n=1 Tax=Bacillus TaxID=1386 RepID=UPI000470AC7C|nr:MULTISPECIES: hypothetical protein [Bacillus]MBC8624449.1 hypothetical protein [Robertmurraya crescens]KFM90564.1 putative membrane protein [Bacillus paralicheniformis]MBL7474331.1 hypothetical protein [Bacillus paralicheniformis]MBU5329046.1 hypothetical protein [Bacillus paralicheniformis]MBU8745497.1 hypothetical protein [Bacillus paralicheniformis]
MTIFTAITLAILSCLVISCVLFLLLIRKGVIDNPPNTLAFLSFILLIGFCLFFAMAVPSLIIYFVSLGVNHFLGDYVNYSSRSDLYIFSLLVSSLALVYMLILMAVIKGLSIFVRIPKWVTYIFEFAVAWIAVYFSIEYVTNSHLSNVSIFQGGELLLSFFITFLFLGCDILFSNLDEISREKLG